MRFYYILKISSSYSVSFSQHSVPARSMRVYTDVAARVRPDVYLYAL